MDLRFEITGRGGKEQRTKDICIQLMVSEESEGSVTRAKSPSDHGDGGWLICIDELYSWHGHRRIKLINTTHCGA